jgi:hypothetical protein
MLAIIIPPNEYQFLDVIMIIAIYRIIVRDSITFTYPCKDCWIPQARIGPAYGGASIVIAAVYLWYYLLLIKDLLQ